MATIVPEADRLFNWEYVQLHSVQEHGENRQLLGEGPLVVGTRALKKGEPPAHVIDIGMPENMLSWQLTPDLPMLKVERTAYMAAVPYSDRFYIIDFLPETPEKVLKAFEAVLAQHTSFAVSDSAPGPARNEAPVAHIEGAEKVTAASGQTFTTTASTADKIRSAGESISAGVATLGQHVGRGIVQAGAWYRKRSQGKQEQVKMSGRTTSRIESVKAMSGKVAAVSTTVAGAVGSAIGTVAAAATDRAKAHKDIAPEGSKSRRVLSTCKVGVVAVVDVFDAMHDAGRHVVTTGADETATCVQYRYGDEAADATKKGMGVAVDAYDVYGSYKQMRTRALAKAFVKGTMRPGQGGAGQHGGAQAPMPMEEGVQIVSPFEDSPSPPPGYAAAPPQAATQPQPQI